MLKVVQHRYEIGFAVAGWLLIASYAGPAAACWLLVVGCALLFAVNF